MNDFAESLAADLERMLADLDRQLAHDYPGDRTSRQPVHTVYVSANAFDRDLVGAWGARALSG
ncbi:DUF6986 family protein [Streptomyces sp. NPDC002520]